MSPEAIAAGLANLGIGGMVLWWFMYRQTPAQEKLERALDRNTRSNITLTLTVSQQLEHCAAIRDQCYILTRELDEAQAARATKEELAQAAKDERDAKEGK